MCIELYAGDDSTSFHSSFDDSYEVFVTQDSRRRVGHQVQGVVYRWRRHSGRLSDSMVVFGISSKQHCTHVGTLEFWALRDDMIH